MTARRQCIGGSGRGKERRIDPRRTRHRQEDPQGDGSGGLLFIQL